MSTPFFEMLRKIHTVPKLTSYTDTPEAIELQTLVAAGDKVAYRRMESEYKKIGHNFRLTKGIVYEMKDEGETLDVQIAVQVKGFSLTWYFWVEGGMDQYPQAFRDKLYNAAARCHKEVERGCDLYYRGSNAVHIKLMHNLETESNHNHNHYRLKDNQSYTPVDFAQHMQAFKKSEIHDEFFEPGEIDELCEKFNTFYAHWTAKTADTPSEEERYFSDPSQQLDPLDIIELRMFGAQQEPCRISAAELKIDYDAARAEIESLLHSPEGKDSDKWSQVLLKMKAEYDELLAYRQIGGSRGLGSERASSRQIKGSKNPVITAVMGMDDTLGKETPDVPDWAHTLKAAVAEGMAHLLGSAEKRVVHEEAERLEAAARGPSESGASVSPSSLGSAYQFFVPADRGGAEEQLPEASNAMPKLESDAAPSVRKDPVAFFKPSGGASAGPGDDLETGVAPLASDAEKKSTKGGA